MILPLAFKRRLSSFDVIQGSCPSESMASTSAPFQRLAFVPLSFSHRLLSIDVSDTGCSSDMSRVQLETETGYLKSVAHMTAIYHRLVALRIAKTLPFFRTTLSFRRFKTLAERRCLHAQKRTMQPSGSQSGGPDSAPDPVRTAVAQAANTVRHRRDLRQTSEVLEAMSKAELILVNTALRACPTQLAATLDPAQIIEKIRAYLAAHERRDAVQLRLVRHHEDARNSLLLAPEGPIYDPHAKSSCLSQICRYKEKATPSDLLEALSQDLATIQAHLACATGSVPPENRETLLGIATRLGEMGTCLGFHKAMVSFAPTPPAPMAHVTPPSAASTVREVTRSYRDAARQSLPSEQPQTTTPAQRQRTTQAREIRRQTNANKAQIRCDERSFQLCPVTMKGDRPSFRQLGISLERALKIKNLKEYVEDIRSDHGGRYYVQIRSDLIPQFERALDRSLECAGARWDLELDDIGTFEVNNPYLSPTKDKIPVVISNVDTDIDPEAAITAIAEQNAARWKIPATELKESHFAAPHRLNRRKRDASGQPLPEWTPSKNLKVFISKTLHEQLLGEHKAPFATLDYMVLPSRPYARFPSAPRGIS